MQEGAAAMATPRAGVMPKIETQAAAFLEAHPELDGRGVVIAVLDTGVDPAADGLQTTTDGKPKVIDVVDCTGDGDVDTSTEREATVDDEGFHRVEGVTSGVSLKLPKALEGRWANPTGAYHVGVKDAFTLFPSALAKRVAKKRREAFEAEGRRLLTLEQGKLSAFDTKHGCTQPAKAGGDVAGGLSPALRLERKELAARVAQLTARLAAYEDLGPKYHCLVWHDGARYRAVVDTSETGDLTTAAPLAPYCDEHEFSHFGDVDKLTYCVQVYDAGKLLSVVADCHPHGTHVATIAAGYYPDQPELNGVAPGAQVVSLKIGDNRLDAMETTHAVCRAVQYMMSHKVDLVNMSFGEAAGRANAGRFIKLVDELVYKHGTIFLSSAGNSGPALSTVGAPGATSSSIIGVGAYVTPAMMADMYSLRQTVPAIQYTWSSRGPAVDGHAGVSITAPGGAIASVPNWTLSRNQLMNGTSMSSPNAAGNVALLLSALKQKGVAYSPHTVRRALENTGKAVPGVETLALGTGVVQVLNALRHCEQYQTALDKDVRFDITIPSRENARGLYLREPHETRTAFEGVVMITPVYHEDACNTKRIAFNLNLAVSCAASWVHVPETLLLYHSGRGINIRVDCDTLPAGSSHYTEVVAIDEAHPEAGPVFRIPITVVRPAAGLTGGAAELTAVMPFEPGQIERRFLTVPEGATWCDVSLKALGDDPRRNIVVHALQLHPQLPFSAYNSEQYHFIGGAQDEAALQSFKVIGGGTLELTFAQFWSSLGRSTVEVKVEFHGIVADTGVPIANGPAAAAGVTLQGAYGYARVDVAAPLRQESVDVSCSLTGHLRGFHPKTAVVKALGERDLFPDARQLHELVLEYEFSAPEAGEVYLRVPLLNDLIYDAAVQSQMLMLVDAHKKVVGWSDAYPQKLKVGKGKHVARLQVCHDDIAVLEALKSALVLTVERVLEKSAAVSVTPYATRADLYHKGAEAKAAALAKGARRAIFLKAPTVKESLQKHLQPGDVLTGSMTLGKARQAGPVQAADRPGGYKLTYVPPPAVPEGPKAPEDKEDAAPVPEKKEERDAAEVASAEAALEKELRGLRIKHLKQLCDEKKYVAYEAAWDGMKPAAAAGFIRYDVEATNQVLSLLTARLSTLDGLPHREERLADIVAAADAVVTAVDAGALAAHYGTLLDPEDLAASRLRKKMDVQKAALLDALAKKAAACEAMLAGAADEAAARERFADAYAALRKWVDPAAGADHVDLYVKHCIAQGRPALALEKVSTQLAEAEVHMAADKLKKLHAARERLLGVLEWGVLEEAEAKATAARFPHGYPCF
eukprot:TRINITY_DN10711_c0_g2_i1.p1 TRINITY_DN10711_c0_g2~~TRINITY_DN10711_c0_g2_i1.p1  ORF type:complete len:1321 (+),score=563.72 TRINITY_DN10711_c0_g2_i1:40-4002(+)